MKPATRITVIVVATLALAGVASVILASLAGPHLFHVTWKVEPLTHIGLILLTLGLGLASLLLLMSWQSLRRSSAKQHAATSQAIDVLTHDLKRPVDEIRGMARYLSRILDELSTDQLREQFRRLISEIETQASNFRLMADNARALAELQDPHFRLSFDPVNVPAIIEDVSARYAQWARITGIAIQFSPLLKADSCPPFYSNGGAISQIVTNLVDNAMRYAHSKIKVQLDRDGAETLCIQVRDDGPGITADYRRYVFDKGWTPEVSEGKDRKTSGMGLYISLELARQCGGTIDLESRLADGLDGPSYTAFTIKLPSKLPGGPG